MTSVTTTADLPTLIRTLRQRLGLSQEKFAAKLGVSFQTVNRWERGRAKPSQLAMNAIRQKLAEMEGTETGLIDPYFKR
ncbi:helix-turn-helix domain-containing protein [Lyngbya sp. CCY1209]|jgi:DNA-binding transcriptional regulator YiaG|uniref:helix-turn-helix domain-containing protein n=1 Tax=Lyngbya sp. CCY1209 TaxID=2886103 RepID=UPI002D200BCF|nr:helix-turn-helix domain-containing protein [Lyngbya sp. CCY1209]MEB3882224.1 helix-turn-helix domain-containing protein [Lyngbya sp. CCY1209]